MGEVSVSFRAMNDEEYKRFIEDSVLDYSKDLIKSGRCRNDLVWKIQRKNSIYF